MDFDFNLYEQFEFEKCLEKANINFLSIQTNNALNNLFFQINLKISSLEKVIREILILPIVLKNLIFLCVVS